MYFQWLPLPYTSFDVTGQRSARIRPDTLVIAESPSISHRGSNKGHDTVILRYSCGPVGCHLRRKVVAFAVSHETHNPKVGGSNPPPATIICNSLGLLEMSGPFQFVRELSVF